MKNLLSLKNIPLLQCLEDPCFLSGFMRPRYTLGGTLKNVELKLNGIEFIVCESTSHVYTIPHHTPSIKKELNGCGIQVPSIPIDSTCLSFVSGLDIMSHLLDGKIYSKISRGDPIVLVRASVGFFNRWNYLKTLKP